MKKLLLWAVVLTIASVAYTAGAKAGKGRYREIVAGLDAIWNDSSVKKARKEARDQVDRAARKAQKQMKKMGM